MAEVASDGSLSIRHKGRGYKLGAGSTIEEVFCDQCKAWRSGPFPVGVHAVAIRE